MNPDENNQSPEPVSPSAPQTDTPTPQTATLAEPILPLQQPTMTAPDKPKSKKRRILVIDNLSS